jgi:hypothetical protein
MIPAVKTRSFEMYEVETFSHRLGGLYPPTYYTQQIFWGDLGQIGKHRSRQFSLVKACQMT